MKLYALFNSIYYLKKYPDLRQNGIKTSISARKHYFSHGINEGRIGHKLLEECQFNLNSDFDTDYYLENNEDLIQNGIVTPQKALIQFLENGQYEYRTWRFINFKKQINCEKQINFKLDNEKPILIICNGKTTNNLDFDWLKENKNNIDTFCMNNSYKKFTELDFYPTYYACLDNIVIKSQKKDIDNLLELNKIDKCFLLQKYWLDPNFNCEFKNKNFISINKTNSLLKNNIEKNTFENFYTLGNTGADCVMISLMLGYKNIYIIGVDGYVEKINECKEINNILEITKTPVDNPNYWFNTYQEEGEKYNYPNCETIHKKGWEYLSKYSDNIINLSNKNYLNYFKFNEIKTFYNNLNNLFIKNFKR